MKLMTRTVAVLLAAVLTLIAASPARASFTAGQSSYGRPGIAYAGGTMYVGWSGTDSARQVNIGEMSFTSGGAFNGWRTVNTFAGTSVYPSTGVAVTAAPVEGYPGSQIIAAWTEASGEIRVGHYVGTGQFSCGVPTGQYSHWSPYLVARGGDLYLTWTGLDSAHHVNVMKMDISSFCFTSDAPVTLTDTATAGPAVTTDGTNLYVAWPGTGSGQNLFVGQYTGSPALVHHTCLCAYKSADDLGLSIGYRGQGTLAYRGTNNLVYHLDLSLNSQIITPGSNLSDGIGSNHGVDVTDVPSGVTIPAGTYLSFSAASNSKLTFDVF